MTDKTLPVAFFDSGLGGISVLRETVRMLPHEDFLYYGDSLHAPYGVRPVEEVVRLSRDAVQLLLGRGIKAFVIACNTATSAAAETLRREFPELPIIGTEPALKPAVERHPGGRILVMATAMTLNEKKFDDLRRHFLREAEIHSVACSGLMEFVERGELSGAALDGYLREKLAPYLDAPIDAIVLGCTHYVFLKDAIQKAMPGVRLFDGNEGTSHQLRRVLSERGWLKEEGEGGVQLFSSAENPAVIRLMERLLATKP